MGESSLGTVILAALKEKGNEAFAGGDYRTAVLCYSEGLERLKDMKVLYTNRAQVSAPPCPRGFLRPEPLTCDIRGRCGWTGPVV